MEELCKKPFYEIDEGKLKVLVQREFERATKMCIDQHGDASVTMKITVHPPEDPNFPNEAGITYEVSHADPKYKSARRTARVLNGAIVGDKDSIADSLQLNLDLPVMTGRKNGTDGQ